MLHWRSGHLRRVVESTLGSETQALVVGLKELEWVTCLWLDLHRGLELEGREAEVRRLARAALITPRDDHGVELAPGISTRSQVSVAPVSVTDCKSVFDALRGTSVATLSDRSVALDMLVARQLIERMGLSVRWVPAALQAADGLTKDTAAGSDNLRAMMNHGRYRIGAEDEALRRRAEEKEARLARGRRRQEEAASARRASSAAALATASALLSILAG